MKITLISTSTYPSDQGIRTISSCLKAAGHQTQIIFATLSENYLRNFTKKELHQIAKICKNSQLIGISSYASTAHRASKIIKFLKKQFDIPIIYGGVHPTISPQNAIKQTNLICIGEGEQAIVELATALEKEKSIDKIKNLWIRENDKTIKNPVRNLIDSIDSLPFPDYNIENHYLLEKGKLRQFQEKDLAGQVFFLTGRGCPYGCDYCSNSLFNELYKGKRKKILRWHSPEYIIKGILYLRKKFPTLSYFDIRDDTFSLRPLKDIKKFCQLYKKHIQMRFKCLADPKTITKEKISLLTNAGCTDIIIGIQGSENTNKTIYHRAQTDADVHKAAQILKHFPQLAVMYDVITCNPYESSENILSLINLIQQLPRPFFLSVNNLVFFPGTKLYDRAKADNTIKTAKDAAFQLNYWDRSKHILLKKKNIYLNLILNLMRGNVKHNRFGILPESLLNFLLNEKRIKRNLRNPLLSTLACHILSIFDLIRERIAKPTFRSLPLNLKVWYDKVRYR